MDLGILISGRGSNMEAILEAIARGRLEARCAIVVSNRPEAAGLAVAERFGAATAVVRHAEHPSREAFDARVVEVLRKAGASVVALAGFDRLVSRVLLDAFAGRVVNIHPALLPSFPGLHAQRQALEYGARVTGATVHFVDEQMDHGPIIAQSAVPVRDDDDEASLSARILAEEHRLYPAALQLLAKGALRVAGRRVIGGLP